jgi:membrane protein implicated in regulation of membrane protease activity
MDSPEQWRWIWLAATAVFAIGEMATPGSFFLAPFAAGALVASLLAFAGVSVLVEWIAFIVVSVAMLALLRPLSKRLDREALDHGVGSRRLIGRQATVLRAIPAGDEIGMVRVDREQWRAQSIDRTAIPAGIPVRIADVQGTRVIVAPMDATPSTLAPQPGDTAAAIQPTPSAQPTDPAGAGPAEATTDVAHAEPAQPADPTDTAPTQPAGSAGAEPSAPPIDPSNGPAASSQPATQAGAEPSAPPADSGPASAAGTPSQPDGARPANGSGEGERPSGAGTGGAAEPQSRTATEPVEPSAEPVEPPASGDGPSPS